MQEKNFSHSKYNICWISIAVIFLGTIIYPIMLEHASRAKKARTQEVIHLIPVFENKTPIAAPINNLPAEESVPEPVPKTESSAVVFTRNLQSGDRGEDVKKLQEYLNSRGFLIAESGPGSPGQESELFGKGTKAALIKFQETYADILLKPYGLSAGTGIFGPATRAFVNS